MNARSDLTDRLLEVVGVEAGDSAVVSAIYDRTAAGFVVRHASLIFGPSEMAVVSWREWSRRNAPQRHVPGGTLGPSFAVEQQGILLGRVGITFAEARHVLDELGAGSLPQLGSLPHAQVLDVRAPTAPMRVFPHQASAASCLQVRAARPMRGFFFPAAAAPGATSVPDQWTIAGEQIYSPDRWDVGIAASGSAGSSIAPTGVLVGRLEDRAWIRDMRGADDPELHYYSVSIGFDPNRISPYDLVVELREWLDGELAYARRIPLEWLDLSAWNGEDHVELNLPIHGYGGKRAVSLYDLGGELLDISDAVFVVESIGIKMTINGLADETSETEFVVGQPVQRDLEQRLARRRAIDDEYRKLIADGLPGRVVLQGGAAWSHLRHRLESARGELLVIDRYFGKTAHEWSLFDNLKVPVRVLVSKPATPPPHRPGLQVRQWQQPAPGHQPPFHDRLFLWGGGGISVGTSAGGLGLSDSRIDSLDPPTVEVSTARFNQLWSSPGFLPV